ncbi:DUF998 domain-containing protein [Streptomyces zaomyceticus]|uniref:DUF998 domain-containing protein n=1 Tax=Streptomyces zaomyceticus TaxID=68286 RepID=UPI00342FE314
MTKASRKSPAEPVDDGPGRFTSLRGGVAPRSAVLLALAAGWAAMIVTDVLNPRIDPISETVSRYVHGTGGWLITLALLSIGSASAVVARWLRHLPGRPAARRAARGALAVWAAGVLVAGLFPADPPGQWGHPSTSDLVHGTAALPAFLALPLAASVSLRGLMTRWPTGRRALLAVTTASALTTVALGVFLVDVMSGGPSLGIGGAPTLVGLVERLAITADIAWVALAAVAVSRDGRDAGRRNRGRRIGGSGIGGSGIGGSGIGGSGIRGSGTGGRPHRGRSHDGLSVDGRSYGGDAHARVPGGDRRA